MYFISKKRSAGFARRALRTNDRAGSLERGKRKANVKGSRFALPPKLLALLEVLVGTANAGQPGLAS